MKRSVILLLLVALVLSAVSCAAKGDTPETDPVPGPSEAAAEEEVPVPDETERLWPDLPDKTYDGADFRFLSREVVDGFVRYYSEISSDEMNGEVMNDTVFNRTQTMETKYGIKIVDDTSGNVLGDYKNSYNAGEQNWDMIVPGYSDALTLAQGGVQRGFKADSVYQYRYAVVGQQLRKIHDDRRRSLLRHRSDEHVDEFPHVCHHLQQAACARLFRGPIRDGS